jgi:shikimate dehydrogenase
LLCVTALHPSPNELARILEEAIQRLQHECVPFLVEFRFDGLKETNETILSLAKKWARNSIFCLRSKTAHGHLESDAPTQLRILRQLLEYTPAYIDIGPDLFFAYPNIRNELQLPANTKLIVSVHCFQGKWNEFEQNVSQIAQSNADIVKAAITVRDASENLRLLELSRAIPKPHVFIGMGTSGILSRLRYRHFNSLWTYVAACDLSPSAPGQFTLDEAFKMGLPRSANHPFIALIGNTSVQKSPGPHVYNTLFRKKNLPWCYVPVETDNIKSTLFLIETLGAMGASITAPHKVDVAKMIPGCKIVNETGAANTLRFQDTKLEATNTDVFGFETPLRKAHVTRGERCLILGAGGAARSAVAACKRIGLIPIVCARDIETARSNFPNLEIVAWDNRSTTPSHILINATNLTGECELPWPPNTPLQKTVVFDCAMSNDSSPLLDRARNEGVSTICPYDMWVAQGARQMHWITGTHFAEEELRCLLP